MRHTDLFWQDGAPPASGSRTWPPTASRHEVSDRARGLGCHSDAQPREQPGTHARRASGANPSGGSLRDLVAANGCSDGTAALVRAAATDGE